MKIYSTNGPSPWTVTIDCTADGDISICSGDCNKEWFTIVSADNVPALKTILSNAGAVSPESGADGDDAVDMLNQLYQGRKENPYNEIGEFLVSQNIPTKDQFWGDL